MSCSSGGRSQGFPGGDSPVPELRRAYVSAATAGQKGLDLVVKDQPEIIISDLTMTTDERV